LAARAEADVKRWKAWLAGAGAVALAIGLFAVSPRFGGVALIVIALAALGAFAYRLF
jgi:hypothetical protein